ncbi:MAG: hypothetical protein OXT65_05100 [Alphaproteobacteria bacterium]|nr:hypothetical protein [Alphaproteobacteria bacterium]
MARPRKKPGDGANDIWQEIALSATPAAAIALQLLNKAKYTFFSAPLNRGTFSEFLT